MKEETFALILIARLFLLAMASKMVTAWSTEKARNHPISGLCSSRAQWPLAPNFCPRATRKSQIFHTNHMPGTLDFTVSEHWAPFNFP